MDPNLSMRHICRALRHWKERLVSDEGVGTDIPPALITLAGPSLVGAYSLDAVHGITRDASVIAAVALSDCDRAVLAYEAYIDVGCVHPTDAALAPLFAAGDPHVQEAVMFTFVTRDGDWDARGFAYTYGTGRTVRWKPPHRPVGYAGKSIRRQVATMQRGFAEQADRPGPAPLQPGAQLSIVGEEGCEHQALISFAVTAPCPCGSQQPIDECCALRN